MHPDLIVTLAALRARRGFDPGSYLRARTMLLDAYLRESGVRAVVVAVSGGVDSAVTLGLVARALQGRATRERGSHRESTRLVAALMPLFVPAGATHQDTALARGQAVARHFGAREVVVDLSESHGVMQAAVERGLGVTGDAWASGQLVSNLRTPALYHVATLLTAQGWPALIAGTTNRDEGSYLGFFGKASDGMVDLQPISDLHKSEVFALAGWLHVPDEVRSAVPTGDTFDGRPDEAMIGAPYDFVELYTALRCLDERAARRHRAGWSSAAREQHDSWAAAVERLHRVNAHKYLGSSPAVHLDVLARAVPGGWRSEPAPRPASSRRGPFVGEFSLDPALVERLAAADAPGARREPLVDAGDEAFVVRGLLDADECAALGAEVARHASVAAGRHGTPASLLPGEPAASWRSTTWSEALAAALWDRLAPCVPALRRLDDLTPTDGARGDWRAVGLNPLMRFIRYERGGWLVPHHDAGHDPGDGLHHTLMSVLIYLDDGLPDADDRSPDDGRDAGDGADGSAGRVRHDRAGDGADGERHDGATRLLLDRQRHLPIGERRFDDGTAPARSQDVLTRVRPVAGSALVLDHRVPHDAAPRGHAGRKLVLRTDVVFARCGHPARFERPDRMAAESDRAASVSMEHPDDERRLWDQVRRDPFYGPLAAAEGLGAALEAGFFDDGDRSQRADPRADPSWLVTPLHRVLDRLAALAREEAAGQPRRWLAVLLTTGAFCPPHVGHLHMMEAARRSLESQGAAVLAGYLSPSHDTYVQAKCGPDNPGAAWRLRLCEQAVAGSDWLMADGWEALHADVPLNFTAVVERLGAYLSAHVPCHRPIRVAYVCGGDNARFALAFARRGLCVVVSRPGSDEAVTRALAHPRLAGSDRVIHATDSLDAASRRIRQGDAAAVAPGAASVWRFLREPPPPASLRLRLRDEGDWALAPWAEGRDRGDLARAWTLFRDGLEAALTEAFAPADGAPGGFRIERCGLDQQRAALSARTPAAPLVSLDPCLPGHHDLAVSRHFALASDAGPRRVDGRPGWPSLAAQAAALGVTGDVTLFDDDVASGATMLAVQAALPASLRVSDLWTAWPRATASEPVEQCDARDFLAGALEAGLVVELPGGGLARAPYLLPYVRPSARASVPVSAETLFSRRLWALNRAFFAAVTPPLLVRDASPAFRALAAHVGFADDTPLAEVCRWHEERLSGAPP